MGVSVKRSKSRPIDKWIKHYFLFFTGKKVHLVIVLSFPPYLHLATSEMWWALCRAYSADADAVAVADVFLVMLQMLIVMLHVFPVMLQKTRATLLETPATLNETRARSQETRATLQETMQHCTKTDYWQIRSIARPLCDSRATCLVFVWSLSESLSDLLRPVTYQTSDWAFADAESKAN